MACGMHCPTKLPNLELFFTPKPHRRRRLVFKMQRYSGIIALLMLAGCQRESYGDCVALGTTNSLAESSSVSIYAIERECARKHPAGAGDARGEAPPSAVH